MFSAANCGSASTSRTSYTGATAACASSNAATTSSRVRAATQAPTASSSSSACAARPEPDRNHGSAASSGRPTSRITRSAMLCALVDTATHRPSAHRYVLRGALFDERLPSRGCT